MNTKKAVTSYYPCPLKASSIFSPQAPPIPMYYARNPVRLTFEDADWGTLTDDEESESEQVLSPRVFVPAKPFLRPKPAEMATRDFQVLGKPLAGGPLGAAAEAEPCEEGLNTDQRERPAPLAPTALPVVTHKDVPRAVQVLGTTCVSSRSKSKPPYFIDTNEPRHSVLSTALILPKRATRSLPPVFSDSDDECDDPLATLLTTRGQPPKQDGVMEPVSTVEVSMYARSYSESPPGDIWAMLIAEETKGTGACGTSNCA